MGTVCHKASRGDVHNPSTTPSVPPRMSKKNFDLCWQVLKQTDPLHKPNRVDLQTAFQNFLQQYDETDHVFQRTQQHSADHGTSEHIRTLSSRFV